MTTITVNDYYAQVKMIGNDGDTDKDIGTAGEGNDIGKNVGTFRLIDDMIRDLVHIKNEVKDRRDSKLIGTQGTTNADLDLITLGTNDDGKLQSNVYMKDSGPDGRGIAPADDTEAQKAPAVYVNTNTTDVARLSEAALFLLLKKSAENFKKMIYGTKANVVTIDSTNVKNS